MDRKSRPRSQKKVIEPKQDVAQPEAAEADHHHQYDLQGHLRRQRPQVEVGGGEAEEVVVGTGHGSISIITNIGNSISDYLYY